MPVPVSVSAVLPFLLTLVLAVPGAGAPGPERVDARAPAPSSDRAAGQTRVLAISVDGLNPAALRRLGPRRTPVLHRLLAEGASTLNARAALESTRTLPNHTSMLTGRRIDRRRGGHGVTWNDERPRTTVQGAAGHGVGSVFSVVADDGGESALFTGKDKFRLFKRSWPGGVTRLVLDENELRLVREARTDLLRRSRELTFVHLALPDTVGHDAGFMSAPYLDAVARTDLLLGKLLRPLDRRPALRERLVVVLTADHGGVGRNHFQAEQRGDHTVPFLAWGAGIAPADLYAMNPTRRDPGRGRPGYAARRQPVRNADLANLVTDLLGLPAVPGSELNAGQDLRVRGG